jgi:hypothetical protein
MIETQVAQLAASCPNPNAGKLPGQPEVPFKENVSAVTTRTGKSTQDPHNPQDAGTRQKEASQTEVAAEEEDDEETTPVSKGGNEAPQASSYSRDPTFLPFPERRRRPVADEQFDKFVEVIKKVYINIPLLDALQVPTYAKYIKDILSNKRTLPTRETVQLTEECSSAILGPHLKKKDPGCPTISCSIGGHDFDNALCDLGASVSVMPKVVFDHLKHISLVSTPMCLQLADQSIRYPHGVAENVPVKIRDFFIPVDFIVLDMEAGATNSLILGRPFLSTANANIDVGRGTIQLRINGGTESFSFRPKEIPHQVNMVEEVMPRKSKMPSVETLMKMVEAFAAKEKKRHDRYHARRRISRTKALEEQAKRDKEVESKSRPPRKEWRVKAVPNKDSESSAQDEKLEPSP